MQYSEATTNRVFILRLEEGEILHEQIETVVKQKNITTALLQVVGGVNTGSVLVVGPEDAMARPVIKQKITLTNVYESTGTGTIFPDEDGNPMMHLHLACGRGDRALTGCASDGIIIWQVMEVIITELTNCSAKRVLDASTGFKLLIP